MNKLLLAAIILFTGCVGTTLPHNPLKRNTRLTFKAGGDVEIRLKERNSWWRATTVGVSDTDNPWNKFIPKVVVEDTSDPWSDFQEPDLFPKEWKSKNKKPVDSEESRSIIPDTEAY